MGKMRQIKRVYYGKFDRKSIPPKNHVLKKADFFITSSGDGRTHPKWVCDNTTRNFDTFPQQNYVPVTDFEKVMAVQTLDTYFWTARYYANFKAFSLV